MVPVKTKVTDFEVEFDEGDNVLYVGNFPDLPTHVVVVEALGMESETRHYLDREQVAELHRKLGIWLKETQEDYIDYKLSQLK